MPETKPSPEPERVSALTALVLLTYGFIRMIVLPSVETEVVLLGLVIKVVFRTQFVMLTLAAALAAAGTDWLVRSHPHRTPGKWRVENWVVPAFAAIAVGVVVIRLPDGPPFWIGLFLGALLLIAILTAEFIVSYPEDPRYEWVATGILALSFLLLTGTFYSIHALQMRALFGAPLVGGASLIITWRLLRLAFPAGRVEAWALLSGVLISQIALGLHYWPVSPLQASLLLAIGVYFIYQYFQSHLDHMLGPRTILEQLSLSLIALALVLIFT